MSDHYARFTNGKTAEPEDQGHAQLLVDSIVRFFNSADEQIAHRFGASRTTIAFHLTDAKPLGCTMYFDGDPVRTVGEVDEDAEAHIYGTVDAIANVILGQEHLGMLIAKDQLAFKGPVRKFLRAVPMMRKLDVNELRELAGAVRARRKASGV